MNKYLAQKKSAINHYLASHGLATLADPRNLFAQLAMGITSHEKFRDVLMRVEPSERRNCYDALKPRLSFTVKPLEAYEREARDNAEKQQLPIYNRETLAVTAFKVPEIHTEKKDGQVAALAAEQETIQLVCLVCTAEAQFSGQTYVEAILNARHANWKYDKTADANICPKCSKKRGLIQ